MTLILLAIIVAVALGLLPTWPYSTGWGYGPSGVVFVLVIVLFVWLLSSGQINGRLFR